MKPIETVDKCTTCSTCVAYCPVTKATRAFKGPKLTGPSSERFRLYDETGGGEISEIEALDYCSNCKNCDIACPSGVKISTLNMLARAEYCKRHKPPLRDWVLSHGRMLGRLARRFPGWLVNVGSTNALTRLILDKFGVDARAPMPVFVPRSFTEWMGDHNAMLTASDRSRLTKKAVFFPGCYVNDYDPQTGKDLVFMLEKAGYEVIVPEFECCGLPMVANGFFDDARAAASRNVDTLAALVSSGDVPVLTVCPSCQLMLKQEYAEYFPELGKHESIVPHVQDACEFLIGLIESGELDIDVREDATKLVYHAPCHLRAQGIGKPGLDLGSAWLPPTSRTPVPAAAAFPAVTASRRKSTMWRPRSVPISSRPSRTVPPEYCVTECGTCRLQISHHTKLPSMHPISWLRKLVK